MMTIGRSALWTADRLLQTPGRSSARQFSIKSPRPTGSIRGIKLRVSATPGTGKLPDSSKPLTNGSGSPRPTRCPYEGTDKDGKPVKVSYVRTDLSTQTDAVKNQVDPSFINDNYWTLFPFHAYWDKSASAIDQGKFNLPVGPGMAELVPIKYPADGGYTPGDTWDLYVGKDNRVVYFVYIRGGAKPPSRVLATWTGYKKAGPILFSTEHRGTADGKPLHIFVSDVAVKLAGSDKWMMQNKRRASIWRSQRSCRNCSAWADRDLPPCGSRVVGARRE